MKIARTVAEITAPTGRRVLVPTMGALHKAHGELMRVARERAGDEGEVVVTIFVNPLQFEPGSDFERYPRPEREDEEFCRNAGVDLLFRPIPAEMYAADRSVFVDETSLGTFLEGKSRPGHFRGVCTVVAKLFNILRPNVALFGEKDFQQLAIIRRMVRDLHFPVEILAVATVREPDGLAFSSRNKYLTADERSQAPVVHTGLTKAKELVQAGETSADRIVAATRRIIEKAPLARIDYIELVDGDTLQPLETVRSNSRLAVAVYFGKTRLIDNIQLS